METKDLTEKRNKQDDPLGLNKSQQAVSSSNYMIQSENLVKIYKTKDIEVMALQGLDLIVEQGELMSIIGNSGSGKSTLLNMIGGLDRPSAGKLYVDGKDLFKLNEKGLVNYKQSTVGFVWQNNARNLFPYLTALQNVQVPMLFDNVRKNKEKALEMLELVGMSHKKNSRLSQLSGGEQQRIAIAIALANSPKLLLADEPTGSVDAKTSSFILDMFRKLNQEMNLTIVIVTHDVNLSKKVNRVVMIRDGKTSSERILKQSYEKKLSEISGFTEPEGVHEEYVVLDRTGRLQLPREILEEMGIEGNKVKLELIDNKIVITKPE